MAANENDSTIENRVYLFKDLAAAFLSCDGGLLSSADDGDRSRALRALADIAFVACTVADGEEAEPDELADRITARK